MTFFSGLKWKKIRLDLMKTKNVIENFEKALFKWFIFICTGCNEKKPEFDLIFCIKRGTNGALKTKKDKKIKKEEK